MCGGTSASDLMLRDAWTSNEIWTFNPALTFTVCRTLSGSSHSNVMGQDRLGSPEA